MLNLAPCKYLHLSLLALASSGCAGTPRTQEKPRAPIAVADDHREDEARLAALFPGARLTRRPLLLDASALKRLGQRSGRKFSGSETEWEIFEASKSGQRVGWAVLAHADLAPGVEMHLGLAVSPQLKVMQAVSMESTNQGFRKFVRQFGGKGTDAPLRVGRDLKEAEDYPPPFAQAVADTVGRALSMLQANIQAKVQAPRP